MATSSIANLFSFFTPSKPPPLAPTPSIKFPPPHLSTTASPESTSSRPGWGPLAVSSEAARDDVMQVVCPSLANANTMYFRSAYNVQVIVDDNEPDERLLGRFRREVMRAGIIQECKRRKYFENKQDEKKRRTRDAAKRNRRRRPFQAKFAPQDKQEGAKKREDDDDNWDLPEGNLPS